MSQVPPPVPQKRRSVLVPILIGLVVILLAVVGLVWWQNRPIKPVQLTVQEKEVVQTKVEALQNVEAPAKPAEPTYEKGKKEIVLTERELNGLLNEHTAMGEKLKFELATNAVHARIETDLDPDLPVVGGKHLKAKARFIVKTESGAPSLILDDLTVWGISLPNDWLGQLKGKDLLSQVLGGGKGGQVAGIEEMSVEPGQLTIRLKE